MRFPLTAKVSPPAATNYPPLSVSAVRFPLTATNQPSTHNETTTPTPAITRSPHRVQQHPKARHTPLYPSIARLLGRQRLYVYRRAMRLRSPCDEQRGSRLVRQLHRIQVPAIRSNRHQPRCRRSTLRRNQDTYAQHHRIHQPTEPCTHHHLLTLGLTPMGRPRQ